MTSRRPSSCSCGMWAVSATQVLGAMCSASNCLLMQPSGSSGRHACQAPATQLNTLCNLGAKEHCTCLCMLRNAVGTGGAGFMCTRLCNGLCLHADGPQQLYPFMCSESNALHTSPGRGYCHSQLGTYAYINGAGSMARQMCPDRHAQLAVHIKHC